MTDHPAASPAKAQESFAAFARRNGWARSYVSQLAKEGRLVLSEDGRAVCVQESLQRLKDTRDPSKTGVAARHAAGRDGEDVRDPDTTTASTNTPDSESQQHDYQASRAKRESFEAKLAELKYREAAGELMSAAEAAGVASTTMTLLRTALENMPHRLGLELASVNDEQRCIAVIREYVEDALGEASRRLSALGKPA